jgi:ubiquinone/menaquinone biosynthesis C-methylase UbiE
MSSDTEVKHPLFARVYIWLSRGRDPEVEYRQALLSGVRGRVIEIGAGNGLNFPHYPPEVTQVVAVEPEPTLQSAAREAAAKAPIPIEVVDGTASALPADDGAFDVGIASLVLCSVPDQAEALAELQRVIRPGGELRFYEHVVSHHRRHARMMRFADRTFWPHISGNCHLSRDTQSAIEAAGFQIEDVDRFLFSPGAPIPALPHIRGVARRP